MQHSLLMRRLICVEGDLGPPRVQRLKLPRPRALPRTCERSSQEMYGKSTHASHSKGCVLSIVPVPVRHLGLMVPYWYDCGDGSTHQEVLANDRTDFAASYVQCSPVDVDLPKSCVKMFRRHSGMGILCGSVWSAAAVLWKQQHRAASGERWQPLRLPLDGLRSGNSIATPGQQLAHMYHDGVHHDGKRHTLLPPDNQACPWHPASSQH